jgi:hypothetical protein
LNRFDLTTGQDKTPETPNPKSVRIKDFKSRTPSTNPKIPNNLTTTPSENTSKKRPKTSQPPTTPSGGLSPPIKLNPYQRTIERRRNNLFFTTKLATPKPGNNRKFKKDYRPLEKYNPGQTDPKIFTGGLFPKEPNEYEINGGVNHTKFLENMNMFAQQINLTDSLADIPENYHSKRTSYSKGQA